MHMTAFTMSQQIPSKTKEISDQIRRTDKQIFARVFPAGKLHIKFITRIFKLLDENYFIKNGFEKSYNARSMFFFI